MPISEIVTVVATLTAIVASTMAWIQARKKPKLDQANTDLIKESVKTESASYNARRDLQLVRLESWIFDKVRPWGREQVVRDELITDMLVQAYRRLDMPVPDIPPMPPFPEMPPPLPDD